MRMYRPMVFNFTEPKVSFKIERQQVTLHRVKVLDRLVKLTGEGLNKI